MKIAIIGSGISGLACAHRLNPHASVTLFEAGDYFGGHTHTVDVTLPGPQGPVQHGVDTGFLVFNARTYPKLIALFAELGVESANSDMSFSVQVDAAHGRRQLEWSGSSLNGVFAQRANLFKPRFWRMLRDLLRFNALTRQIAALGTESTLQLTLAEFLQDHGFSAAFRDGYLLPMLGCIWSCPTDQMLAFPVATMIRFCHNHGLLQITQRPQWMTVRGGARNYVERIVARIADKRLNTPVLQVRRDAGGALVTASGKTERFDQVVLACHSDQALALLGDASVAERALLGAIRYQPNEAVLHTDRSVLPQRKRAWAAWNYARAGDDPANAQGVCLHYLLNRLQPLPFRDEVIVTLNPLRPIAPQHVLGRFTYSHPVFDLAAIRSQSRLPELQGQHNTWYCGAWTGYGFHEDGLASGLDVAKRILDQGAAGALLAA